MNGGNCNDVSERAEAEATPAACEGYLLRITPRRMKRWCHERQRAGLGPAAESVAAQHLEDLGFTLLKRNLRLPIGEIDILALAPSPHRRRLWWHPFRRKSASVSAAQDMLVIVEVKAADRVAGDLTAPMPEWHVNAAKQRKLTQLGYWLSRQPRYREYPVRFDVIAVDWPQGGVPTLRHHRAAFEAQF